MDILKNDCEITAYVDGACWNNGQKSAKGGWAFVICFEKNKEIHSSGYIEPTTNQRMELTALIKALEEIKAKFQNTEKTITILSDSEYVVKGVNDWMFNWEKKGWQRTRKKSRGDLKNLDLWKRAYELVKDLRPVVKWIKGHNGNEYNELCDALATTSIQMQEHYYKMIRK